MPQLLETTLRSSGHFKHSIFTDEILQTDCEQHWEFKAVRTSAIGRAPQYFKFYFLSGSWTDSYSYYQGKAPWIFQGGGQRNSFSIHQGTHSLLSWAFIQKDQVNIETKLLGIISLIDQKKEISNTRHPSSPIPLTYVMVGREILRFPFYWDRFIKDWNIIENHESFPLHITKVLYKEVPSTWYIMSCEQV